MLEWLATHWWDVLGSLLIAGWFIAMGFIAFYDPLWEKSKRHDR